MAKLDVRQAALSMRPQQRRSYLFEFLPMLLAVVALASLGWVAVGRFVVVPPVATAAVPASASSPAEASTWSDTDEKRCTAAGAQAASAPLPDAVAFANPSVTTGFANLATIVHCKLATRPARFCAPAAKQALVALIQDYYDRVDLVQAGLALQGAPMTLARNLVGGETTAGKEIYDDQEQQTLDFMKSYDDPIRADLRDLTAGGVVAAADFGAFMGMGVPERMKTLLGDVKPQASICA